MTRAVYDPERCQLTISGHAGYAPRGESIVCAALSILGYTAVAAAKEAGAETLVQDGKVSIYGKVSDKLRERLDTVWMGLEIMAGNYPEYVVAEKK